MGVNVLGHSLAGWTPTDIDWHGHRPDIRWCFTEGIEFTDPFFEETIDRCHDDLFRLLFWRQTTGEALTAWTRISPGLPLAGIVFHLSRCGSTLLSRMLGTVGAVSVMSEPPVIDHVLRARTACPELTDQELVHWLRTVTSALGQSQRRGQERLVIKVDAWAIRQWPLIRQAFPHVPFVFLYRDPVEVLVSHLGHRGFHMIPGSLPEEIIGISTIDAQTMTPEVFGATVLRRLGEAALAAAHEGQVRLINYRDLPRAVADIVTPLFSLDIDDRERAAFTAMAERDAKNPFIPFAHDSADKQKRASAAAGAAVDTVVKPVYDALEVARLEAL